MGVPRLLPQWLRWAAGLLGSGGSGWWGFGGGACVLTVMGRGGDGGGTGRGDAPGVLAPEHRGDVRMVMWDGTELKNTDLTAVRNEWLFRPPQPLRGWLESTVAKERDFPMIYLIFNITAIVLPSAFCQYRFADQLPWWTGLLHVVMIVRAAPSPSAVLNVSDLDAAY